MQDPQAAARELVALRLKLGLPRLHVNGFSQVGDPEKVV